MDITITSESIYKMKEFYFIVLMLLINIYGILMVYIDKYKSKKNKWRIKEQSLFLIALLGGAGGIMMGMTMFRHKTQHKSFTLGIPLLFTFNILIGCSLFYWIYIR